MNSSTLLLRQVNPNWIHLGRVTSQAFTPTPKDNGRISTYDGDRITPEESWNHFTRVLGYNSAGVLGVTVEECESEGLTAVPDPKPFPEHVLIDLSRLSRNQRRDRGKLLTRHANARGWLHYA